MGKMRIFLLSGIFLVGESVPIGSSQSSEIQFKKNSFGETSPGSRAPNTRERIIQGQMGPHRGFWSNIDHMYREVLGMNTDQVIVFRDGEFRPVGNVKMNVVWGKPTTEMKMKALVAKQRNALMTFPKDPPQEPQE